MKRLKYRNNWENDVYSTEEGDIDNIFTVLIDGESYAVARERRSVSYSDHGHTYTATSYHYFIKKVVFGTLISFDLNTIVNKVPVFVVEYQIVGK